MIAHCEKEQDVAGKGPHREKATLFSGTTTLVLAPGDKHSTAQGKSRNELEKCAWTVWESKTNKDPQGCLSHFRKSLEEWMANGNKFAQKAASRPSAYRGCHWLDHWSFILISMEVCHPLLWVMAVILHILCLPSIATSLLLCVAVRTRLRVQGSGEPSYLFICLNVLIFIFFEWSNYKTSDSSPNKLTLAPVPGRAEGQSSHWCNPWVEWEEAWPGRGWLNWLLWSSFALSCPCFHLLHVHRPQEQLMQSRHIHKP